MCHHVTPTSLRSRVLKTLFFTDRGGFRPLGYSEIICLGKAKLPATYSWSGEAGFRTAPCAVCRRGGLFDGGLAHPLRQLPSPPDSQRYGSTRRPRIVVGQWQLGIGLGWGACWPVLIRVCRVSSPTPAWSGGPLRGLSVGGPDGLGRQGDYFN